MNINKHLKLEIIELINALVDSNYNKISQKNWYGRLNKKDIETKLSEYGKTLISPPDTFVEKIDTYNYNDGSGMAIDVPLWTKEEGMSDLTLSLELLYKENKQELQMTNLDVL